MTEFRGLVTNEAINKARLDGGWYIVPKEFRIFDTAGQFIATRTISGLGNGWYHHDFNSSNIQVAKNKELSFTVTIPANASLVSKQISEICFIAQTAEASPTEYLYVIIQPTTTMTFEPGTAIVFTFEIALNNIEVSDTCIVRFSIPVESFSYEVSETI